MTHVILVTKIMKSIQFLIVFLLIWLCGITASPITMRRSSKSPIQLLNDIKVIRVDNKFQVDLSNLIESKSNKLILVFLTHLGDLGSWELSQKLNYYLPNIKKAGYSLIAVAPGSLSNALTFCDKNSFPNDCLYIDNTASTYKALEFSKGAFPDVKVSPYLKLLPMLAGIESKGTIPEVLRGYFGDKSASSDWIKPALRLVEQSKFDIEGTNYQRPFELATLRLQNMIDVLKYWNDLIPEDLELLTQQGGAYVFKDKQVVYEYKDTGILAYMNVEKALENAGIKI